MLRGSKVLSRSSWTGRDYQSFFATTAELAGFLRSIPVAVLAVDRSSVEREWFAHQDLLCELLEGDPETWQPIGAFDVVRNGRPHPEALHLYRLTDFEHLPKAELNVAMALGNRRVPGAAAQVEERVAATGEYAAPRP